MIIDHKWAIFLVGAAVVQHEAPPVERDPDSNMVD
jgi:hypothetical protein